MSYDQKNPHNPQKPQDLNRQKSEQRPGQPGRMDQKMPGRDEKRDKFKDKK